jgi:hypothetical protein
MEPTEAFPALRIPWNRIVIAKTHDAASVYRCPECGSALERRRRKLRATPAAEAATKRHEGEVIVAIECYWRPGGFTDDGREILGEQGGRIWAANPDNATEYFATLRELIQAQSPEVADWPTEKLDFVVAETLVRTREAQAPEKMKEIEQDRLLNGPAADRRIIEEQGLRHYLVVSLLANQSGDSPTSRAADPQ